MDRLSRHQLRLGRRKEGKAMSLLAGRMAVLLRKALLIVAYEWVPELKAEQAEKQMVVNEGWRVLDEYAQRMGKR